ncbi:MAG: flagellar hook-basal body protein [Candidatus Omnitrophota bacterium]
MKNSIYSTTAGMLTSAERLNVTANNLANFNTTGFKSDLTFEQTIKFLDEGPYPGKDQPILGGTMVNPLQGVIQNTGRKLDLALDGPGFFTVQTPNNQELYTRNGSFTLNSKKELVNQDGYLILDKFNKKITVYGNKLEITPRGDIMIDDAYYTTLKIINISGRENMEKVGTMFFKTKNSQTPPTMLTEPNIVSGALEHSNVNLLEGLAETSAAQRTFDFQRTAADLIFRNLRRSITDVPRPM